MQLLLGFYEKRRMKKKKKRKVAVQGAHYSDFSLRLIQPHHVSVATGKYVE